MKNFILFFALFSQVFAFNRAPNGPWDKFNLAPADRTVRAASIKSYQGIIQGADNLLHSNTAEAVLQPHSSLTLDFGKEVGGQISFRFGQGSGGLWLAYTESPLFIGNTSDLSVGGPFVDGSFQVSSTGGALYTTPLNNQRGGFRYMTIVVGSSTVKISNLTLYHTWMPHWKELNAYSGYFYSSDNLLNRIWYSGAYTVQLCSIDRLHGRAFPFPKQDGWINDGVVGEESPILVDAPKRDRTAWIGDLGISLHTSFVSTDLLASRNSLNSVLNRQHKDTGMYNYCGPPWSIGPISDTYHAWSLVASGTYFQLSNDTEWAKKYWPNIVKGMNFMLKGVDGTGLFFVTHDADWLRPNTHGRHLGANCLFYRSLTLLSKVAVAVGDNANAKRYLNQAKIVKKAVNQILWSEKDEMFTDNDNTTVTPQDGNSMAIIYGLADQARSDSISKNLRKRWNKFGPVSAEWPGVISPFISGFEVMAHFASGNAQNGLDLIRLHWGYLLNSPNTTQSTFVEGLLTDGSFGYMNPPFLSQSHGWSTGPTPSLSYYVVGLQVEEAAGTVWGLSPSIGDLSSAEGGFSTLLGFYSASWKWNSASKRFDCTYSTPSATTGNLYLNGLFKSVLVNNKPANFVRHDGRTMVYGMPGGKNTIIAQL
eukprot:TRINITY_DN1838_c0_g1_i1.p1 TRINITY_DN1838_c0_g1~~TRINITY_DN1838_c0_g1_i1.p1  ORF type:complete len:649 (+),score=166.17 TRINITY_DN1838_c0_g1_i1:123-2069(+)